MIICFFRNKRNVFFISQLLIFVFALTRFSYFNIDNIPSSNRYEVIEKRENYVILENEGVKFLFYNDNLSRGNMVRIEGVIKLLEDSKFSTYLKKNKINYLIEGNVISNDNYLSFQDRIINFLLKDKDEENKSVLKLVLFNIKDDSNNSFYKYFETFSISFLLVVSGYHINYLLKIFRKRKIFKHIYIISYLYLLNFSVASFKAYIYYVLKRINNKLELPFNNNDLLSLIMIAFIFYNPSYCFNLGFIYSFLFSFILDLLNNVFLKKTFSNNLIKKILIYCFTIPIILLNKYSINTGSFIANLFFAPCISILFVFSFVYLFLDKFYLVYKLYIYFLNLLLDFIDNISLDLVFGEPSVIVVVIMYGCLMIGLYYYQNKLYIKSIFSFVFFIFICFFQYNIPNLDNRKSMFFLDVGQGDCLVFKISNSKKVVLVDTGGSRYRDIANDVIIPFLKSKGINEIEKVIISHDDYDHCGALIELKNNFKINSIVDDSSVKEVYIDEEKFINLNISESRDNDGSIALYGRYGGIDYFLSGDISSVKEKEIIDKYNINVDVLKVSHHGANGSSSEEFLKSISPQIALIGVGKNNIYKHPSEYVINRLKSLSIKIYRTDEDGNIEIYKSLFSDKIVIIN